MKLQERLPGGVIVRGHFYRLDFDFRNVLRLMETIARDDLLPEARDYLALGCLMRRPPKKRVSDILAAVREILALGQPRVRPRHNRLESPVIMECRRMSTGARPAHAFSWYNSYKSQRYSGG